MVLLSVVGGAALAAVAVYKGLVRLRVAADGAWSDIDVQLKRRHDLVPNLVETVSGYAAHERRAVEAVIGARARAMTAGGPAARGEAESSLSQALGSLLAVAEAYPQLRAVEAFTELESSLAANEDALEGARRYYNAVVRDLNTRIEQPPSNLVARACGFAPRELFERAVPPVVFGAGA